MMLCLRAACAWGSWRLAHGVGTTRAYCTPDIYGGTGAYKGADGVMVDTFIGPAGATSFPINGWGFFWLPSSSPAHA